LQVAANLTGAYINPSHSAWDVTDGGLAICRTCHVVQPCLNGLLVAFSRFFPLPGLTVEQHRTLIVDHPILIPMLLPWTALVGQRAGLPPAEAESGTDELLGPRPTSAGTPSLVPSTIG
jgi:hypothetical protein